MPIVKLTFVARCIDLARLSFNRSQDKPHSDEWHQVTGGSGEVNVQIQYKAAQNVPLTIDAFELLKVVGKGSFGKVWLPCFL